MGQSGHVMVFTTTGSADAARALAESAVKARLAACAQVQGPVTSVYNWDGHMTVEEEWRVLYKTSSDSAPALSAHISAHHTYDLPEIVHMDITGGSPEYLGWVESETRR